jgi:hypothetical protein
MLLNFRGQLVYFIAIWNIFMAIWNVFSHFGMLYQEKSGNPEHRCPKVLYDTEIIFCLYAPLTCEATEGGVGEGGEQNGDVKLRHCSDFLIV